MKNSVTKDANRYYLVEKLGYQTRCFDIEQEYNEFVSKVNKYNDNTKNTSLIGSIVREDKDEKIVVVFNVYKKIVGPVNLKKFDEYTLTRKNVNNLKSDYKEEINDFSHPLYLVYRAKKDIKKTSMLFEKDEKYLSKEYLANTIYDMSKETPILTSMRGNINLHQGSIANDEFEKIMIVKEQIDMWGFEHSLLINPIYYFVDKYTKRRNKYKKLESDYSKLRRMACYVKEKQEEYELIQQEKKEQKVLQLKMF